MYAGLLVLFLGYAALARGREDLTRWRPLAFGAGIAVLWAALETPVDSIADHHLQSVHMFQHVLLGVIAPPLLVLGLPASMAGTLVRVPGIRALTEPVAGQLAAAAVMVAWHVPALYELTLRSEGVHVFEHLLFIASGVMFWWPMFDATAAHSRWRLGDGARLFYLLVGTLPQDGVAIVLQFSRQLFYPYYGLAGVRLPNWDPVVDQTVAGAVLQLVGKTSYLVAALAVFYRWVERDRADEGAISFR